VEKEPMPTPAVVAVNSDPVRAVLVVGATGFLGRSVVRAFSAAGEPVRGLARDAVKAARVREDGGNPVLGDILDVESLRAAAASCRGVIHVAANPSEGGDPTRVRVEGTRNLVEAARREGVARLVIGSGYWVYRGQAEPIHEDAPVEPRGESQINYDAERAGLEANSPGRLEVLAVRPGMVYGNGSWFRTLAESVRSGEYRVVGPGSNRWSFVDRWDAGTAFRTVLESGGAGQVYNVVDGHPASLREFADFVASELHAPPPQTVTPEEAAREMGEIVARHVAADRPTSDEKLRGLGWRPQFPTYRDGIPGLLREMFPG
jgi:2-alkyl-3-oxoalkanoate reductase